MAGLDVRKQREIDALLGRLDNTSGFSRLGANAVLGVSLACCRAGASIEGQALFEYIAELAGRSDLCVPLPMVNILSGGAHARAGMDIQDFMVIPVGAASLEEAIRMAGSVRTAAAELLSETGISTLLADEGGLAPGFGTADEAFEFLVLAIQRAGLRPGDDLAIAVDVAATELLGGSGEYRFARQGISLSSAELVELVKDWPRQYPVVSIEDPLADDDWAAWQALTSELTGRCQLVGDDVFCTSPPLIAKGAAAGVANAVLIKPNQIGTLSATLDAIQTADRYGYRTVVSARSGETEDTFIVDLAVGVGVRQIKIGSLRSSERLAKYNQLLRIEETLGIQSFARWEFETKGDSRAVRGQKS